MRFVFIVLTCALAAMPRLSWAVLVEDLYRVELRVEDQTTATRLQAFNDAFRQLLVKVSGSDEAFSNPGLKRPLRNSSRYVHQFRYFTRKQVGELPGEPEQDIQYLMVMFNRDLVESLLRENGVPLWGRERPSTLLVVHYRGDSPTEALVSGETTPDLIDEFDEQARSLGLPVLFPLLDLEDLVILGHSADRLPDAVALDALSSRYGPDVMLTGNISVDQASSWQANWQAGFADKLFNWSSRGQSRQALVEQSLVRLARILASEYALQSVQVVDQDVMFRVDGILDIDDYVKVLAYLQSLDAVENAGLVSINSQQAVFRVRLRNTAEDLHRLISLGFVLEQSELPQINAAEEKQLVRLNYRLIR